MLMELPAFSWSRKVAEMICSVENKRIPNTIFRFDKYLFIFLCRMGKKDKHNIGQSRNNPVFKVANGKLSKNKGKAKEVCSKLKQISKHSSKDAVKKVDDQLKQLQNKSVNFKKQNNEQKSKKIQPAEILKHSKNVSDTNIDSLVNFIDTTMGKNK